tara:strand:+ start:284 stop:520 length:237 start_codon:yes stop_codon:yes gene_type:complete
MTQPKTQPYTDPKKLPQLMEDDRLSDQEKLRILDDWALDLDRKIDSANENMWPDGEQAVDLHPEEQLRRVNAAKESLD